MLNSPSHRLFSRVLILRQHPKNPILSSIQRQVRFYGHPSSITRNRYEPTEDILKLPSGRALGYHTSGAPRPDMALFVAAENRRTRCV
jgi:hypothetical protein